MVFIQIKSFTGISRSNRTESREVAEIMQSNDTGLSLHLFKKRMVKEVISIILDQSVILRIVLLKL